MRERRRPAAGPRPAGRSGGGAPGLATSPLCGGRGGHAGAERRPAPHPGPALGGRGGARRRRPLADGAAGAAPGPLRRPGGAGGGGAGCSLVHQPGYASGRGAVAQDGWAGPRGRRLSAMAVLPSTDLIPVAVAQEMLLGMLGTTTAEVLVPLREARGRVLARTVVSGRPLPGCDNSAMDGYAVSAADCAGASAGSPVRLAVNGEARAGAAVGSLVPGTAMAISTGAPVPQGADAIIPVEEVAGSADAAISVMSAPPAGRYIRRAGEDVVPGTVMLPRGRRLRAADIAACAAVGAAQVWVSRPPRVAILSGGDELVPVGAPV